MRSSAYLEHYKRGPFPGHIDPFAEAARYFHQIHNGMIHVMQETLQDELIQRGYQAGREASLQIVIDHRPDIYIKSMEGTPTNEKWDYEAAATAINVQPGTTTVDAEPELESLHIYDIDTGDLVTVVGIISPGNKLNAGDIALYKSQRQVLFLAQGVNVVELDLTRSVKHLLSHMLVTDHHYHIAVFLPGDLPRILVCDYGQALPLPSFALPLREEVIPIHPQQIYDRAYRQGAIAGLCLQDSFYDLDNLPFPSLLDDAIKSQLVNSVARWQGELTRLESLA